MRCLSLGALSVLVVLVQAHQSLPTLLAAEPPERLSEADAIAAVKAELAERVAEDQFSGAVLIARAGQPVFQQAYGYADREQKIPNTLETKFIFGSMAKMFTDVAVMQLVQAGKIQLDDTVAKHLPDYPNKEVAAATIHQLLTHTGGTGDVFGPEFGARRRELKEHKDYVALYGERAPRFPPGSRFEYSNYGMVLLGRIIEVASGQSYYDYVRDHILTPAGIVRITHSWLIPNNPCSYLFMNRMRADASIRWTPSVSHS
jgi:CubicO group peptidase (beta-lactamase class C family)